MPSPKWEQQASAMVDKFLRRSSILARAWPANGASAFGLILTSPPRSLQVSSKNLQFTLQLGNLLVGDFAMTGKGFCLILSGKAVQNCEN